MTYTRTILRNTACATVLSGFASTPLALVKLLVRTRASHSFKLVISTRARERRVRETLVHCSRLAPLVSNSTLGVSQKRAYICPYSTQTRAITYTYIANTYETNFTSINQLSQVQPNLWLLTVLQLTCSSLNNICNIFHKICILFNVTSHL